MRNDTVDYFISQLITFPVIPGDEYLSFMFNNGPYLWYQADMDIAEVLLLHLELKLSEGLNKRHALNVPNCAS